MKLNTKLLLIAVCLAVAPAALASTTWYVNGVSGSDSNDCKSSLHACRTIGHAIGLAASGDSITIAAATYTENLFITSNLKLNGARATKTIIDGGGINRVIAIENTAAVVTLNKLTIRNGIAAGGGGILNWGTLTVSSCTISGNAAASSYSATGAGIYNSGTLTISNSTLSGNAGGTNFMYGGGIYSSGRLVINNSTLSGNSAAGFTGGGGGGIYVAAGTAKISSSTFSGNSGSPNGGAIYNGGTVTLRNSIVANSTAGGNCYGTVTSNGHNLSSDGTCSFGNAGDLNNTNPMLGPLQSNGGQTQTMALPTGSPAIDAGNPRGCTDNHGKLLKTDQRGQPRPDKEDTGGCDMGAYESQTD
jgi:predicted outer membrane repeat protein